MIGVVGFVLVILSLLPELPAWLGCFQFAGGFWLMGFAVGRYSARRGT